jgi:CheY-like chemotaxis protein
VTVLVLLVDDQTAFRRAAARVLARMPDFRVVGEVETGEASVTAARELKPDLVLMDVRLPGIDGPEATRQILAQAGPQNRPSGVLAVDVRRRGLRGTARRVRCRRVLAQDRVQRGNAPSGVRGKRGCCAEPRCSSAIRRILNCASSSWRVIPNRRADLLSGEGYDLNFADSLQDIRAAVDTGDTDVVIADAWGLATRPWVSRNTRKYSRWASLYR